MDHNKTNRRSKGHEFLGHFSAEGNGKQHVGDHYEYNNSHNTYNYNNGSRSPSPGYFEQKKWNRKLFHAAKQGETERVRKLLQDGADVDARDEEGWNALQWAVYNGKSGTTRLLIEAGSDVNARTATPLPLATISLAAKGGDIETIKILASASGLHVDQTDGDGRTALYWAARHHSKGICTALVSAGSDVNAASGSGATAIHYAAAFDEPSVIDRLLSLHGVDVNKADVHNNTPLHRAASRCNIDILRLLLRHECMLDLENQRGSTALQLAARNCWLDGCKDLIQAGATVSADMMPAIRQRATELAHDATRLDECEAVCSYLEDILGRRNKWKNFQGKVLHWRPSMSTMRPESRECESANLNSETFTIFERIDELLPLTAAWYAAKTKWPWIPVSSDPILAT